MKTVKYILTILLILIQVTSCKKDFLDKKPLEQYSDAAVWTDLSLMQTFTNYIYSGLPQEITNRMMMNSLTDESVFNSGSGSDEATKSLISPSDYVIFDRFPVQQNIRWENDYRRIRSCNLFLEQAGKNTYTDAALKDQLTGEVLFLRAYNYYLLAFYYGGVPIITKPYGLVDDFLLARNTFEETINFIVEDCDKAADLLPLVHASKNDGRATKGAALALKSRVLLYAASDLYNSNGSWTNGYANPELVGYVGGSRIDRWTAAKNAAKAVIDLGAYSLYNAEPAPTDDVAKKYAEIFLSMKTTEDIFVRNFTQATTTGEPIGFTNSPGGYGGWGNTDPTQQFVDSFEMIDGTKFDWNDPVMAADPYKNREPRFYADINYEGAPWRIRPANGQALDPVGVVQVGFYQNADGSWNSGLDTRSSPVAAFAGTYTGYYMRKFIDPTVVIPAYVQNFPFRFIRYTEVLLSYAEACAELGEEVEARNYANMIRKRAGVPDITESGSALVERIQHERTIELSYESDRHYLDIRRWMTAPQAMTDAKAIDIRVPFGALKPTYNVFVIQTRKWDDKWYFLPIKLAEMNKNNLLIQNPLY